MVNLKEIIYALEMANVGGCNARLIYQIQAEGIAPPDGWVLARSEPTDEMADRGIQHLDDDPDPQYYYKLKTAKEVYKAMLAVESKGVSK